MRAAPRITLRQSRRDAYYGHRNWDQNGTKKCFTWDQMPNFAATEAKNTNKINGRGEAISAVPAVPVTVCVRSPKPGK